ncbi:hypothetical protein P4200_32155 [Pseudomonas aeruginosa]|nr:hypothetical protein [Pseudomonas aeruginosa]
MPGARHEGRRHPSRPTGPHPPGRRGDTQGSVGAFIANARLLLEEELPAEQRRQAEEDLRALLPAIRALGLLELFELRDARLRTLVADWENAAGRS